MAQTQLAYQSEVLDFNHKLVNSLRSSTYTSISNYLGENEFIVSGTIPTLLPALCSFLDSNKPQSRDFGKISALVTHYRESLGNFNLNNIEPNNFPTLTDIGTTDLTELLGSKLSALLDNISLVSGLKEESVFTLLALLTPYLLKQVGMHLPKGQEFTPSLLNLIDENKETFQDLIRRTKPNLVVTTSVVKESYSLFPYFIILSLSAFFIFNGLNSLVKSPINFKNTNDKSIYSITNYEKKIRQRLGLIRTVNSHNSDVVDSDLKDSLDAIELNASNLDTSILELQFDPNTRNTASDQTHQTSKNTLNKEIADFVNGSLGINLRTFNLTNVKFGFGDTELSDAARMELLEIIPLIKTIEDLHIEIAGHTDNTGDEETNKKISKERAGAVATLFIQNGIAPTNIQILGYGSSKPIASNSTLEGRYLNRRIELLLAKKK